MKELENIYQGLVSCNTMLMKATDKNLECLFLKRGIVHRVVLVKNKVLAQELLHLGCNGILEGADLQHFRYTFCSFRLHVQSRILFLDLNFRLKRIDRRQPEVIAA